MPTKHEVKLQYAGAIFGFLALLVSFKSCSVAKEANSILSQTLRMQQRPYLSAEPIRVEGFFLKASDNKDGVVIKVKYEMKNSGSSPAHDVALPNQFEGFSINPINHTTNQMHAIYEAVSAQTIPPGGVHCLDITFLWGVPAKNRKSVLKEIENGTATFTFALPFSYKDTLVPQTTYRTLACHEIKKNYCTILASNME